MYIKQIKLYHFNLWILHRRLEISAVLRKFICLSAGGQIQGLGYMQGLYVELGGTGGNELGFTSL